MSSIRLMVLTDFTAASTVAAAHCYQLASPGKTDVLALHVVSGNEDIDWAEKKTADQLRGLVNYNAEIPFKALASVQNLFSGLNKWLDDQKVALTFMATHGKKDIQFITGSLALKLILNAEAPIVVVQQRTPLRPYRHILLPIFNYQAGMQFHKEALLLIIKQFDARITLITPTANTQLEKDGMDAAIGQIKALIGNNISGIDVKTGKETGKKFAKEVITTASELNCDLMAVIIASRHHREVSEKGKNFFQSLITNEEALPVLCL